MLNMESDMSKQFKNAVAKENCEGMEFGGGNTYRELEISSVELLVGVVHLGPSVTDLEESRHCSIGTVAMGSLKRHQSAWKYHAASISIQHRHRHVEEKPDSPSMLQYSVVLRRTAAAAAAPLLR